MTTTSVTNIHDDEVYLVTHVSSGSKGTIPSSTSVKPPDEAITSEELDSDSVSELLKICEL